MTRLQTDQQGLLDLRGMRAEYRQGRSLPQPAGRVTTVTRPVVVELLDDIDASDYSQHEAKLVTLYRGTWVDTGQRVPVRCVSEASALQGTRFIVEPVGRLGLCFDLCACVTPAQITLGRMWRLVGPQDPETGLEDTAWKAYGTQATATTLLDTTNSYFADVDFGSAPTIPGSPNRWRMNMHPMRWQLGPATFSASFNLASEFLLEQESLSVAHCNTTPPDDSHVSTMQLQAIGMDVPAGVDVLYDRGSQVTHARVLIGGVDVTGIQEINWGLMNVVPGAAGLFPGLHSIVPTHHVSTAGETLYVDLWVQYTVRQNAAAAVPTTVGAVTETRSLSNGRNNTRRVAFMGSLMYADANKRRKNADVYRLTFSNNGPGGLTELVLQPQAGWVTQDVGPAAVLMEHQATQDWVWFTWGCEVPQLLISIHNRGGLPDYNWTSQMRYLPVSTGDYETVSGRYFGRDWQFRYGVWDCQGTTVFATQGRLNQFTREWLTKAKAPTASLWDGFPTTITVERV